MGRWCRRNRWRAQCDRGLPGVSASPAPAPLRGKTFAPARRGGGQALGLLIHGTTLKTTGRTGRNAGWNNPQFKDGQSFGKYICAVSPEHSVVRPSRIVQGVGPEAVGQHHPLAEGLVLVILLRELGWPVNAEAGTVHRGGALVDRVLDALAL